MTIEDAKDWYENMWKMPDDVAIAYVEYPEELPEELVKDIKVQDIVYLGHYYDKGGTYLVFVGEDNSHSLKSIEKNMTAMMGIYGNDNIIKGHYPSEVYVSDIVYDVLTCPCEHCKEYRAKNFKPLTIR